MTVAAVKAEQIGKKSRPAVTSVGCYRYQGYRGIMPSVLVRDERYTAKGEKPWPP
jgi:hypothetical protein